MEWSYSEDRMLSTLEARNRRKKKSYLCCCFKKKKETITLENDQIGYNIFKDSDCYTKKENVKEKENIKEKKVNFIVNPIFGSKK